MRPGEEGVKEVPRAKHLRRCSLSWPCKLGVNSQKMSASLNVCSRCLPSLPLVPGLGSRETLWEIIATVDSNPGNRVGQSERYQGPRHTSAYSPARSVQISSFNLSKDTLRFLLIFLTCYNTFQASRGSILATCHLTIHKWHFVVKRELLKDILRPPDAKS